MKKYSVIYSDPPWQYDDKAQAGKRGAEFQYPTMTLDQIRALPVSRLAADDCVLFLWVTPPMMPQQLKILQAWGFKYKTVGFTWVKRALNGGVRWGMGSWTRANPEYCVIGTRGKPKRVSAGVHSVVEAVPGRHSEKPAEVRDRIVELCGDVPRLEMFAREEAPGWDVFGNQVDDSLEIKPHSGADVAKLLRRRA